MTGFARLKTSTGDTLLDLLALSWATLFDDANQGDYQSRADLIYIFGVERLAQLYPTCILWDPRTVPTQMELEVTP